MISHNICFHGEIRKKFNTVWLKKVPPYLELWVYTVCSGLVVEIIWVNMLVVAFIQAPCLLLAALWVNFSADDILKYFFFIFLRKHDLTVHANCLQWRQFA